MLYWMMNCRCWMSVFVSCVCLFLVVLVSLV